MALVRITDEPIKLMKSSSKARDVKMHCALCNKKLESQYDWHAIVITRETPYERNIPQKMFTTNQFDKDGNYIQDSEYCSRCAVIKVDAVYPDWHRNRKAIVYCCKDCIDKLEEKIFDVLP